MDMANGTQPLPYGHSAEAAVDIEGLAVRAPIISSNLPVMFPTDLELHFQLLEDHLSKLREEEGILLEDEDDDAAWEGWDEDSSDSSSESEGWVDVEDDGEDLVISDSEDEDTKGDEVTHSQADLGDTTKISQLAMTKVSSAYMPQSTEFVSDRLATTDLDSSRLCTLE